MKNTCKAHETLTNQFPDINNPHLESKIIKIGQNITKFCWFSKIFWKWLILRNGQENVRSSPVGPKWTFWALWVLKMIILMLATTWNMFQKPQLNKQGAVIQSLRLVDQIKNSKNFQISPIFWVFFKVNAFFCTDNIFLTHSTYYLSYLVIRKVKKWGL